MSQQIPTLQRLISELSRLPGIGEKTAERLCYFILKTGSEYSDRLKQALSDVQINVKTCQICYSYTDLEEICHICRNPDRDLHSICVVEQASDIFRIESAGAFKGQYHVLQGALSPLDGVLAEDLRVKELFERLDEAIVAEAPIKEIILALDADIEGDTTALYLAKMLEGRGVRLTRIAHGVPFGTNIDYIDQRTLCRALENRVEI
ncbi:MAG: recombination protein RecR [Bdellovibrionales bacterium CG10_big_fil_rev_8_21_14_0_10_45_34]|nr:MAG: recombination protein RecR [Bdellovibrionales bacterium CG10_big_fil_rev_8_21_14_0_10_45_34]